MAWTEVISPVRLRSPELLLESEWGPKVHIWALGVVLFELLECEGMFSGEVYDQKEFIYQDWRHLYEIIHLLGPIPQSLLSKANPEIASLFRDDGFMDFEIEIPRAEPLEKYVSQIHGKEKENFLHMIRNMLLVDPNDRKSARELLDEPWLNEIISEEANGLQEGAVPSAPHAIEATDAPAAIKIVSADGNEEMVTTAPAQPQPRTTVNMQLEEKHIVVSPAGTGYITPDVSQELAHGLTLERVLVCPAGLARSLDDNTATEDMTSPIATPEHEVVDLKKLLHSKAATDADMEDFSRRNELEETHALKHQTGSPVHAQRDTVMAPERPATLHTPPNRGLRVLRLSSWRELLQSALWFCTEAVVRFFHLLH
jgi:serine/threonine protein kinase